jgi:secernin
MCDCLVALTRASAVGRTLFAKNSDRPPDEPQRIEWLPPARETGPVRATYVEVEPAAGDTVGALVSRPWWLWGVEHGVNQAGVAIGNETIFTTLDPRGAPPALVGMDLVRLGLQRATTAKAALEVMVQLLERYGQGGSGHVGGDRPYWSSFLVADPAEAWVLETSGTTWAAEWVGETRAISNRTTIAAFDAEHRHPKQPVATLVDPRLRASEAVLARPPVDVAALKAHLRSHVGEDGWTVCMHVPDVEATTASLVAELPSGPRPLAHLLLGSPCMSVYVPLFVGRELGFPVEWERFAVLAAEHREVLDELEAGLVADVRDDDDWNAEAWSKVDRVLSTLGV